MTTRIRMRVCPKCRKQSKMWKTGTVWIGGRKRQKYLCRHCGCVSAKTKAV